MGIWRKKLRILSDEMGRNDQEKVATRFSYIEAMIRLQFQSWLGWICAGRDRTALKSECEHESISDVYVKVEALKDEALRSPLFIRSDVFRCKNSSETSRIHVASG